MPFRLYVACLASVSSKVESVALTLPPGRAALVSSISVAHAQFIYIIVCKLHHTQDAKPAAS